jgi:hypothetical protein
MLSPVSVDGIVQRRFLRLRGAGGASASSQKSVIALVFCVMADAACFFAYAVAFPLAAPATAFAPLNHMPRNGFLRNQGFLTLSSFQTEAECIRQGRFKKNQTDAGETTERA